MTPIDRGIRADTHVAGGHRGGGESLPDVARTIAATVVVAATFGLAACSAAEPVEQRDPNAVRVAFYGDSYTLGTGASDIDKRWSTVISEQRGWSEFNPSVNGLGFINNSGGTVLVHR